MTISYSWLSSFFDKPLPPIEETARMLTLHAYEVERVFGDTFEIDVLPNRAHDSLSHIGIARELAALLDIPFKEPSREYRSDPSLSTAEHIELSVEDSRLVPRAAKRIVMDVAVAPSPAWLRERLAALGQRSINNIVDATNYVTFELGQPVHAFDFDKIAGDGRKRLAVRLARDGESIRLLDDEDYALDSSVLVISDEDRALDIAGIKGGADSCIDADTKTVVLSVCNFNSTHIRKTAQKLGLRTDASQRFQHGISPELVAVAMERLTALVAELSGGMPAHDFADIYPNPEARAAIDVPRGAFSLALGVPMSDADIADILDRFKRHGGFLWEYGDDGSYRVTPSPWRLDITIPEDVIEEIGRVYGYEKIPARLPEQPRERPAVNALYYYGERVRDTLTKLGFSELYTHTFVDVDKGADTVRVANPLAKTKPYLRTNLSHNLDQKLAQNIINTPLFGEDVIRIFEIGHTFSPLESVHLAIAARPRDDAIVRVAWDAVCKELGIADFDVVCVENGILEIDFEKLVSRLPLPESYADLAPVAPIRSMFTPISQYPFILRDIAVWVPEDIAENELVAAIRVGLGEEGNRLLVRMDRFDRFEKDGRVSYAFHLVFQSYDRTLTDAEVNIPMAAATETLNDNPGWRVR